LSNDCANGHGYYSAQSADEFCEDAFGLEDHFQFDQTEGSYGEVDDHDVFYPEGAANR
jgi:hypothetical protein